MSGETLYTVTVKPEVLDKFKAFFKKENMLCTCANDHMDKDSCSFECVCTSIWDVMEAVVRLVNIMKKEGSKENFRLDGLYSTDYPELVIFTIKYFGEEPLIKSAYWTVEEFEDEEFEDEEFEHEEFEHEEFEYVTFDESPFEKTFFYIDLPVEDVYEEKYSIAKTMTFKQAFDMADLGCGPHQSTYEEWYNDAIGELD